MLAAGIKDVMHCGHGHHMVPRAEITKMLSDDGKSWRVVCKACKDSIYERRSKAKRNSMADAKAPSVPSGA